MRSVRPPLIGTYAPPAVKRGERVTCLFRDRDCVVTSWTNASIPWPRVQPCEQRGGSGLWVNEILARAIRTESAEGIAYWFGVSSGVVWRWRKAFGVSGTATTPGSKKAHRRVCKAGAEGIKTKEWTDEELDARSDAARRSKQSQWFGPRWTPARGVWTAAQLALLGTDHDMVIAKRIGRTLNAVTVKRVRLKVPAYSECVGCGRAWTANEISLLGTDHDQVVARKTGRSVDAITWKRLSLRIRAFSGFTGGGRAWASHEIAKVGTDTDEAVAEVIGRTANAVMLRRTAMGIPIFLDKRSQRRPRMG
jgi:hypothetical protein